jgi:hypothetical protein
MNLIESEKQNPQDYFLQSGVDEQGNPIYDLLHSFINNYLPNKAIRKKVFDGEADIVISADTIHIYWKDELIAQAQLEGQVEVTPGDWQGQLFSFADANIKKINWRADVPDWQDGATYNQDDVVLHNEVNYEARVNHVTTLPAEQEPGVGSNWQFWWVQLDPIEKPFYRAYEVKDIPALGITDAVFGMDAHWAHKDTKLSFYLDTPGENVRIRWQVRVKDSAVAWTDNADPENPVYHKGLSFNVSDYEGEVNNGSQADPEPGWTIHWWTFEQNGKQIDAADARTPKERYEQEVGLVVDPYLSVDEQGTYIDVSCDGYLMSFPIDTSVVVTLDVYDPTKTTKWFTDYRQVHSGGNYYHIQEDSNKVVEIIENNSIRIKIRVKGNFDRTTGPTNNYLANSDSIEVVFTVFPDRYFVDIEWICSGTVAVLNHVVMARIAGSAANLTNENSVYENSGSESNAVDDTYYAGADYIGWTSDQVNATISKLYDSGFDLAPSQYNFVDGSCHLTNDGSSDETAGTKIMRYVVVIDSASREGSAKIYNSTDRLAMGDQYKDAILDQSPSKGDDVTDMVFPARISSGTLHADGAHHYEVDANDEVKYTLDRTRIRPNTVIHDWPFQYGTVASPTSILLNHLKMDDNAANNTLLAEVGPNGSWHAVSDGAARNTNTSGDSVAADNFRGRALDTQDGTGYAQLAVGSGTVHDNAFLKKGSILLKITPQFIYTVGTNEVFLIIRYDGSHYINAFYSQGNDRWTASVKWANTILINGSTITSDYELQRPYTILFSWDSDKDFLMMAIDGIAVDFDINTGTPTTSHPIEFFIGCDTARGSPADIIIDEIKTFSEAVLPYGAYFIGNGSGLLADIDNPHADLSWYFDGQAAAAKGGANLASDKNPTNSGGSFVTTDPIVGTNHWDANGATNVLTIVDSAEDIVDYSKGFVAGWFQVQSAAGGEYLIDVRDADGSDRISAVLDASNNIDVTYRSNSVDEAIVGDIPITDGVWFFFKITWDDTDKVHCYINGQENGTPQDIANTWGGGSGLTWYFTEDYNGTNGVDAFIGNIYMGKDLGCPEILSAFGVPLHIPLIDLA